MTVAGRTRCNAGPDGNSLLCGKCGGMNYVIVTEGIPYVNCPSCGYTHLWYPMRVCCAAPSHNDTGGCENTLCWKRRSGL